MPAPASELVTPVLLVAMPQVLDPFFHKSVVLLIHHQDEGSFGFIVNRPTGIKVTEILNGLEVAWRGREDALAFFGGPVQPQLGTVLFEAGAGDGRETGAGAGRGADLGSRPAARAGPATTREDAAGGAEAGSSSAAAGGGEDPVASESTTELPGGISLTQHVGDLSRLAERPPERFRLYLGYAGWGAGQLIAEILRNDWLTAPVASDLIFAPDPEAVWAAALASVGVDPSSLPSWTAGGGNGEEDAN